jgi:hypothetical protein
MYIIKNGLEINIKNSQIDPEYLYTTEGIVLNQTLSYNIFVLSKKIKKIPNSVNYIYFDCAFNNFVNSPSILSDYKLLPIANVTVDISGFITKVVVPNGTTITFNLDNEIISSSINNITHETTDVGLQITDGRIIVSKKILDLVQIYVHEMGVISNLNELVDNINMNVINLKVHDLDGSYVDVNYQYLI